MSEKDRDNHIADAIGNIGEAIYELDQINARCAIADLERVRKELYQLQEMFKIEEED